MEGGKLRIRKTRDWRGFVHRISSLQSLQITLRQLRC